MENKQKVLLISLMSIFTFSSCNQKSGGKEKILQDELIIQDSLVINSINLVFDDIENEKILFHNPVSFDIHSYDMKLNKLYTFNKFGNSPEDYQVIYNNVYFANNGNIGVGNISNIKIYDLQGNFKKKIDIIRDNNTLAPIMNFKFLNQNKIIYHNSLQGNSSDKSFYKQNAKVFNVYDFNTQKESSFVDFPNKNSTFISSEYYYLYPYIFYSLVNNEEELIVINKNDPIIYKYDLKKNKLKSFEKLNLYYYNPFKIKFGKTLSDQEMEYAIFQNSSIQGIYYFQNKLLVQYTKNYSLDELKDYASKHPEFPNYDRPNLRYCIKIINSDFDFVVPEYMGKLISISPNGDFLLFQKKPTDIDEIKNQTIIYKVKLKNLQE